MRKLIEEHRALIARREEIIRERAGLHAEMIEVENRLAKLHDRITKALEEYRETGGVEHIDLEEPKRF